MDRQAATKIIKDTFESSFDKARFINLSKNLVKYIDDSGNFSLHGNYIPDAYDQSIRSYDRVGKYEDSDGNKIDVLIVRLKKEHSLERARTMQRNFVAWYLNGSRGGELKDAALVAFISPDDRDWRFSLVRMDYNLVESPTGRVKVEKELTPARRYSFLVGESESSHTAQVQLLPILENDERKPLLSDFEKAFNVEVATKEFFKRYRELFHKVEEALQKLVEQNKRIRDDFEAKGIDTVNFAKKLLGQIVFLYFLQKKGWFGVGRDEDWGTGPEDFLRRLFEKKIAAYSNFFNDVLEPLFYEALAVERTEDFYSRFNCKIPFLNGGLFDPINNYDWVHTDILLPNGLFSNNEKTKEGDTGTGILDVFDRYNFTVKEDEPLDKEVAVDPEMLGRVFENLLEVKDRKSKGTYYTPREIVHYMCQESLINYLDTAINTGDVPLVSTPPPQGKLFGKPDPEQGTLKTTSYRAIVPREDIEAFIRMGELAVENDETAVRKLGEIQQGKIKSTEYKIKLKSIQDNAQKIDDALSNIRVCDPAIGSGAFPVGLMTEIVRARNTLTTYLPDKTGRTNYHFKWHAIQNCLYGVDIDPGAVEIAKLRLWLSLVVDEEDIRQIQPLPNLDYKIMQGNSLIEDFHGISLVFGENGKGRPKLFEQDSELLRLVENLHRKQDKLFNATHPGEKEQQKAEVENAIVDVFHHELKRQRATYFQFLEDIERKACQIPNIEDRYNYYKAEKATLDNKYGFDFEVLERELREITHGNKVRPFFPWKLYFANVFREKGGFDVVIANPPYLKERDNKKVFEEIIKTDWGKKWHQGKMDFWYFFLHRAIDIVKKSGVISFITSRYWLNSAGAKKLINRVEDELSFINFVDIGKLKVFDEVAGQHMVAIYAKDKQHDDFVYKRLENDLSDISPAENTDNLAIKTLRNSELFSEDNQIELDVDELTYAGVMPLGSIFDVSQGVVQNPDKISKKAAAKYKLPAGKGVFVLSDEELKTLNLTEREQTFVKPFFDEHDIHRYLVRAQSSKYLLYLTKEICPDISQYPNLKAHLEKYKKIMSDRRETKKGLNKWFHLHWPRESRYFEGPKIVLPAMFDIPLAGYQEEGGYFGLSSNIVIEKDAQYKLKYLLPILNSHFVQYWFRKHGKKRGVGVDIGVSKLREFPVKKAPNTQQREFVNIIDKIFAITKDEGYLADPIKQARVKELEHQIDQMVYELYGLTPEEIAVVEGETK